jgi:uncharacterized protein (DUF1684 family)
MARNITPAAGPAFASLIALCAALVNADDGYLQSIAAHRLSIDAEFRDPATSPIPESEIPTFSGLDYFPVDPGPRMAARFEPSENTALFRMPTFSDEFIDFSKYGYLTYQTPDGAEVRVSLYQREDIGELGKTFALIPFRDHTNGETTYSGGRYVELTLPLGDPPVIDFNRASNPYCAYDTNFSCPIPPKENWLPFAVQAGEKAYH